MSQPNFDITPSPKVLALLGNIEYAPWQCISELIDNSVDAFVSAYAAKQGFLYPEVAVALPPRSELGNPDSAIEVTDNGPGMSPDDLQRAVKAGYSGNDPISKLGLFGMGFNIATARLGRRTEVWTTRTDDELWTGVAIDFDEMTRKQTFQAPRLTKPKTAAERDFHGTIVRIQKLDQHKVGEAIKPAGRRAIREQLSKTYSNVIQKLGLRVTIDGTEIEAHRFCVWNSTRKVSHKELGEVPAVLEVEHDFGDRTYCTTCWVWLEESETVCPICASTDGLKKRARVLRGWLGIQRYFDKDDFGLDLIRNGRAMVLRDKRFFSWTDPNTSQKILEYPIDGSMGGRIVGELEMDFVPVTYQKNAFEWDSPEFRLVYEYVHGAGPILPDIAKKAGYQDVESPLRKVHGAYRGAFPAGLRNLLPGDSAGKVINKEPQEWAAFFQKGDTEYQDDTKWYEAVLVADEALKKAAPSSRKAQSQPGQGGFGDLPFLDGAEAGTNAPEAEQPVAPSSVSPEVVADATDATLSGTYSLALGGMQPECKVTALIAHSPIAGGKRCRPTVAGGMMEFRYNPSHGDYVVGDANWADDLLIEVAYQLRERARVSPADAPLGDLVRQLRMAYFPATATGPEGLRERADKLLGSLAAAVAAGLGESQPLDDGVVTDEERQELQHFVVRRERMGLERVGELVRTGEFPRYLPRTLVPALVRRFPWTLGDRRFFVFPHEGLEQADQEAWVDQAMSCLHDAAWLVSENPEEGLSEGEYRTRLRRSVLALDLLEEWRAL